MRNILISVLLGSALGLGTLMRAAAVEEKPGGVEAAVELQTDEWTFQKMKKAFAESGRRFNLSEKSFGEIQERKKIALQKIDDYLKEHLRKSDPAVLKAFEEVPREYFQYHYADRWSFAGLAYEENAKPWAIGYGSALSDYLGQAYMTQLTRPTPDSVVLEIGTGSGFQISLLSRIVKKAYSIEIVEPLGHCARLRRQRLEAPADIAEHAAVQRRHEPGGGRLGPGGVAIGVLEERTFPGQPFEIGRRPAIVAVEAHLVRAAAVNDVEDDVGPVRGARAAHRRRAPQRHGACLRGLPGDYRLDGPLALNPLHMTAPSALTAPSPSAEPHGGSAANAGGGVMRPRRRGPSRVTRRRKVTQRAAVAAATRV